MRSNEKLEMLYLLRKVEGCIIEQRVWICQLASPHPFSLAPIAHQALIDMEPKLDGLLAALEMRLSNAEMQ